MKIEAANRSAAAKIYTGYRNAFLKTINGTLTKALLIRDEDVQVLNDQEFTKNERVTKRFLKQYLWHAPTTYCHIVFSRF
ncbi:hypothetical protein M7775_13910 [Sporomusa sphaeroides DSM 2875]|uniref:hypothetical protein n=1 Tax=Sporomusa sphaeroides TaxID=47679 RepID=UPI00202FC935|nr:hypothetical protein [Sporomusa sphaeroides]MCM0759650.1 hypothetical protein [Sporomusa sphaeroides DSM 2875]